MSCAHLGLLLAHRAVVAQPQVEGAVGLMDRGDGVDEVDVGLPRLADAVGTVHRLLLHDRVEVPVREDDAARLGDVEPDAARLRHGERSG